MLALARAYERFGRLSEAFVIVEQFIDSPNVPAEAWHLHAQLLVTSEKFAQAAASFSKAKATNPQLVDSELEETLKDYLRTAPEEAEEWTEPVTGEAKPVSSDLPFEESTITFADVGGMTEVKKQIRLKIILPMENPDIYKAYGAKAGGGILMYGPPGCGKTLLARATAGEVKARFMAIGIHEVLDMWIGQSERNLHELFEQARANRPCVLFFDEVDALAASRTDMKRSAGRQLINQFLDELDGIKSSNEGLLILAATNAPWHLDSAFRRPGRFDRVLLAPPPDHEARKAIFQIQMKNKPKGEIDWETLAKRSNELSGADIKAVIDSAVEAQLEKAAETGEILPIQTKELLKSLKQVHPSVKEWFSTAKNYALYSNQGGHYDDILDYLKMR